MKTTKGKGVLMAATLFLGIFLGGGYFERAHAFCLRSPDTCSIRMLSCAGGRRDKSRMPV